MITGFLISIFIIFAAQAIIKIFTRDDDLAIGLVALIWFIYAIIDLFLVDGFFMKILSLVVKIIELMIASGVFYAVIANKNSSSHQSTNELSDKEEQWISDELERHRREADEEQRNREEAARQAEAQRKRDESERRAEKQRQRDETAHQAENQRRHDESNRKTDDQDSIKKLIIEENKRRAEEQRKREEAERRAAEQQQREESERQAAEQRKREEAERRAAEQQQREEAERQAEEQLKTEKNAEHNKKRSIKHKQIDFKNKIVQSNVKNTDYINKFSDMNKVMINATNNIAETDKMIKKYSDAKLKLPFDLDDYNTFKNDLEKAILNYWVQKRGYDGEKRAREDILNDIENTDHSYFYYHILTDVNVPFTYTSVINDEDTNNKDEVQNEGSTQIDILVISNYGVYALEVKNYDADQISIEGVKTKNNNQRFEKINGDLVPLAYIKRSFNDEYKDDKLMDGNNMINHQTYLHEKAMVNFVQDNLNMSNFDAKSIVYSTLVYANDGIDEYGKDKDGNKFFSGNNVEKTVKTKSGRYWKPFRTTAVSSKGCFQWIINFNKPDGIHKFNSLSNEDVDKLYELLEPYSGSDNEIAHSMYVFNESPEEFQKFIGRLYYLNKRMEKRLSNK